MSLHAWQMSERDVIQFMDDFGFRQYETHPTPNNKMILFLSVQCNGMFE